MIVGVFYNILLPLVFLLALPGWVIKMYRRGGFGTGLLERLALFKGAKEVEPKGGVYVHAVSVGEAFIALKLIRKWRALHQDETFVLAVTTATGHAVARDHADSRLRVIYSPVDFPFTVGSVLDRFAPKLVVLIESELWYNFLRICKKRNIPTLLANARLSPRSEKRYKKLSWIVSPLFSMLSKVLVQDVEDRQRWESVGVKADQLENVGSIKFDHELTESSVLNEDFVKMIEPFLHGRKIIILLSTAKKEEAYLAEALAPLSNTHFLLIAPRHMERREIVCQELREVGYKPVLRSKIEMSEDGNQCFVIDSTGELAQWTRIADVAIVGKSWLQKGGQNPAEAMAAEVPVIVGPHMQNFEFIVNQSLRAGGLIQLAHGEQISQAVMKLSNNQSIRDEIIQSALTSLAKHRGATERTINVALRISSRQN